MGFSLVQTNVPLFSCFVFSLCLYSPNSGTQCRSDTVPRDPPGRRGDGRESTESRHGVGNHDVRRSSLPKTINVGFSERIHKIKGEGSPKLIINNLLNYIFVYLFHWRNLLKIFKIIFVLIIKKLINRCSHKKY